ncbi:hypothetical protein K435DRAFT_852578 [Dendrothele bispora CBS 962.96]|uniref:Uncharacterized protein n=1 Tax=Dendrothele bispora (strain CBS 962.96) TaxID=1314807 RepID=A0A4S8MIZ5_DENBC|nr:hypothetical protein K435DRAFT_852578 [Dendrothele bispora CBS 962.96]
MYRFGNPTPLPVLANILVLSPTACYLMGWGGSDVTSMITLVGPFYFIGGLGMVIGGVMEWASWSFSCPFILGNTFPFVVFTSFGAYWLSLAALQDPIHAIASAYTDGIAAVPYNKGLMFYFIFWTVTVTIYFIGSLRTNFVFVIIFFTLILTFAFFAAAYGQLGNGNLDLAQTLLKAAGACAFANICVAWYLVTSLIMRIVEMPFTLPVFAWGEEITQQDLLEYACEYGGRYRERREQGLERPNAEITPKSTADLEAVLAEVKEKKLGTLAYWDYYHSMWILGENTSEMAKLLEYGGALDARELYPVMKVRSLEDYAIEFYQ